MRSPFRVACGMALAVAGISGLSALYALLLPNVFLSTAAGVLTLMLFMWCMGKIRSHIAQDNHWENTHTQIVDALGEIARGNFHVILQEDVRSPHSDMAEAFNKMAKELGDLEIMRRDFTSNVSHEIQSPLTSIGGFAALLKNDELPASDRRRYIDIIEMETKRLSSLSDNLLKLTALDGEERPLSMRTFRLDKQIQQAALAAEPQWSAKNLNLEADLARCEYRGDADLLNQVWTNLIHNAIKFTPDGGDIRIALTVSDAQVTVIFSDSGIGIAPEDKMHIFERFYKADKARDRALGGNGLGLSLAKKIVALHGGSIAVDSEIGKGAVFTVTLPRSAFMIQEGQ